MHIGIDGNEANVETKVGIGEYAYELLEQFYTLTSKGNTDITVYLKDKPRDDMPTSTSNWKYKVLRPRKLWTQFALPLHLLISSNKPDVFFSPSHYAPRFTFIPTAISIMDLSYIHFPELFAKRDLYQLINWTNYSIKNAKKIFTISNASKDDILKEYKIEPRDVTVTYPGIREAHRSHMKLEELTKKYSISQNYILFVGTLQPRKNIVRLIEAFADVKKNVKEKDLELVIVGKKGWLYEEILSAPDKYGVSASVKFLDFVPNEDLSSFYENALCFVLPSLYEGFGLPVLEAMKYGCPVITSNVSSLPEAGGDAALYVNPEDISDISQTMKKLITSPLLRKELVKKGYQHIKHFSWEKTAKETLQVLQEIAER